MRARPTIKDIAAEVGVSHTTVSYILSGNTTQKISPATRKAVLDAAKRLQYVPNSAARSLRNNSTHCVSVAMEKALTNTRFSGLLQGIRESLQAVSQTLVQGLHSGVTALHGLGKTGGGCGKTHGVGQVFGARAQAALLLAATGALRPIQERFK